MPSLVDMTIFCTVVRSASFNFWQIGFHAHSKFVNGECHFISISIVDCSAFPYKVF